MWPVLDAYGAKIAVARQSNVSAGLQLVIKSGGASQPDTNALIASGFVLVGGQMDEGTFLLNDRSTFTLKELKDWFPGFDAMTMIDRDAPVAVVELSKPSQPVVDEPAANDSVESHQEPPAAKEKKRRTPRKEKIVDAGEKIGRARKDFYTRIARVDDLPNMTEKERDRFVKKSAIWPYSFKEAKERGVSCAVAVFIKDLRASMPEMGMMDPAAVTHEVFIRGVTALRRHFDHVKTGEELLASILALKDDPDWSAYADASKGAWCKSVWFKKHTTFKRMMSFGKSNIEYAEKRDVNPLDVLPHYPSELDDTENNKSTIEYWWTRKLGVKTEHQLEQMREKRMQGPKAPERPHLDHLRNDWLNGEDITAEQLMLRFGFRAVEFGEWLPQDERQRVLNEAYAACAALAETLGIPDRMVSLNGTLAAAFGSRGKGKAAAHFEPDLKVFNLTRMNGAGSMAHEWGHALDNYVAERLTGVAGSFMSNLANNQVMLALTPIRDLKDVMMMTADPSLWLDQQFANLSRGLDWGSSWLRLGDRQLRNEAIAIMREEVLKEAGIQVDLSKLPNPSDPRCAQFDLGDAQIADRTSASGAYERLRGILFDRFRGKGIFAQSELRRDPYAVRAKKDPSKQFYLNLNTAISSAKNLRAYLENPAAAETAEHESGFFKGAKKLDTKKSKDYWSTGHEMFARAFECYVFDKLNEAGRPCEYLVHSVEGSLFEGEHFAGNPYPSGDERRAINAKMADLAACLQFLMSEDAALVAAVVSYQTTDETYVRAARALQNGANPNQSIKGETMFEAVARRGSDPMADLLIQFGLDTGAHDVRLAALVMPKIADALLRKGDYAITKDIDARGRNGYTLLGYATQCNNQNVMRALIDAGAGIDMPATTKSRTPLEIAIQYKRTEAVDILLDAGAEITDRCMQLARGECSDVACYLDAPLVARLDQAMTSRNAAQRMRA